LFAATNPALSTSRGQSNQVAPGLVIKAFSAIQGDSVSFKNQLVESTTIGIEELLWYYCWNYISW
jgi:hypothetical protein